MQISKNNPFNERVHSAMKILSMMRFNLLIMPIVLNLFQPLSFAGRKGYGKMMQVRMAWCQGCKNALNFLTPDKAILNLPNVFLQ